MFIVFHSWQSKNITGQFILVVSEVFHKSPFPETLPYARKVIFTMCFVIFVTQCFPLQQSCFHCPHIFLRSYSVLRIDFFGKYCVHVIKHCHMYDLSLMGGNHFPSIVWFRICDKQIVVVDIFFNKWAKETIWCNENNTVVGKFLFRCWHVIILRVRWIWTFFDMFGFVSSRKHFGYRFFACGQFFICLLVWVFSQLQHVFCYVSFIICLNLCYKNVRKTIIAVQNVFYTF